MRQPHSNFKKLRNIIIVAASLIFCLLVACDSGEDKTDHSRHTTGEGSSTIAKSPAQMAMANIGDVHVHVGYNAPAVRHRIIWGGLVPYGEVWVTGAHTATSIDFSGDVEIAGQPIPKGKYAFFTIPGKEKWTLILNRNWEQHLTDEYDEQEDVIRWEIQPDSTVFTEQLRYEVNSNDSTVGIRWEKILVQFKVTPI